MKGEIKKETSMDIVYYSLLTAFMSLQYYFLMASLAMAAATDINTDRAALLALRSQLSSDTSHILSYNWSNSSPVCSWVGVTCGSHHGRIIALNVSTMRLTGNIVPQLGNLSFLVSLDLSRNNFSGRVPHELSRLGRLRILEIRQNNITGEFPSWFGCFQKLESLSMSNNTFTGVIPPSLSNLSSLEVFEASGNLLQGGIPREIGDLQNLRVLDLRGNQLTGSIPVAVFKIPRLKILSLAYNRLQGPIPRELGNSTLLEELYLHVNELTGEIPIDVLNVSTLRVLSLSVNLLAGNLPSNFGHSLPNMEALDFVGNNLTDEFPDLSFITSLTNCRYLKKLAMSENPLNGRLPSSIGNLSTSLEFLFVHSSCLYGSIPDEIGNLSNLVGLGLSRNYLSGPLPKTLGTLRYLQGLFLYQNKINGTIQSTMCNLVHLYVLRLNENMMGNDIPYCIGNLTSLRIIQLGNNKLNSTLPTSLWNLKDLLELNLSSNFFVGSLQPEMGNLRGATLIDLSMNQLSGVIPNTVGDLNTLSIFLLNHNKFQGSIPEPISQMVSLENLDLSHNNISGQIPISLQKLKHLIQFNVSFNDLIGEIPSDGPFKDFTSQSVLSNKGLCGDQKYDVPPCHTTMERSKRKTKLLIVLVSTGASVIFLALILAYIFAKYHGKEGASVRSFDWSGPTSVRISYYELMRATNGFSESSLLGSGSFGSVYKATLISGKDVAVKVFNLQHNEGASKSFEVECEVLRELRHKNLCKVVGSCSNQDFKALVLEYMPSGSLEKWLYSHNNFLDIVQRITIMIDLASALEYIHHGYNVPIIHCDLKPSNVLLDEHLTAHLCDFGNAKLLKDGESAVCTLTLATMGYIAPEFGLQGLVSSRCDVYSYGIVLIEVFTRMRPNDEIFAGNLSLRSWVKDSMPDGIIHVIDSNLLKPDEEFLNEKLCCLSSIFELALCCSVESPSERINIKDVRITLEKIKHQLLEYY